MAKSGKRKATSKTTASGKTKPVRKSAKTGRFVRRNTPTNISSRKSGTSQRKSSVVADDSHVAKPVKKERHLRLVAQSERLARLIDELGNNRVADLLSVSPSQPSRWRSGKEGIGAENQRKLIDLDYVFGRLEQLFPSRQAEIWLTSYNAHLGGRPIDVLRIRGAAPVIEAIDAEAQGAFA